MSLVICSNGEPSSAYDRYALDQAPYRFRNHLVNPIDIPANSEVAVINVKVNKNGLIRLTRQDKFYVYFNLNMRTNADAPVSINETTQSTGMPIRASPQVLTDSDEEYVNIDDFAERMTTAMLRAMPHPDLDTTTTKCEIARDHGGILIGPGFVGFKLTYSYLGNTTTTGHTSSWSHQTTSFGEAPTMNVGIGAGGDVEIVCELDRPQDNSNHNIVWANELPLSHQDGKMIVNLDKVDNSGGAGGGSFNKGWGIGLARPSKSYKGGLQYLDSTQTDLSLNNHFYDYVIYNEQNEPGTNYYLKVGHAVYNDNTEPDGTPSLQPGKPMIMKEIVYWDDDSGNYEPSNWDDFITAGAGEFNRYNMSTNTEKFNEIMFQLQNEVLSMYIRTTLGGGPNAVKDTWYLICSYSMVATDGATKLNIPKPAGQSCWNLYPKAMIRGTGRELTITEYYSRDTGFSATDDRGDWFIRNMTEGSPFNPMQVDSRWFNRMATGTDLYKYRGVSGAGAKMLLADYQQIIIMGDGRPHYQNTNDADMQHRLGFTARSVLDYGAGTNTDQKIVYVSDAVPNLIDYSSQFIRLDNFPQRSYNAGQERGGRPSKILYHMPRFDTSNRDKGSALYFEPNTPIYCKFHNSDRIKLNELQLSICDRNEKLVEDLTGNTIISLHIRQSETSIDTGARM